MLADHVVIVFFGGVAHALRSHFCWGGYAHMNHQRLMLKQTHHWNSSTWPDTMPHDCSHFDFNQAPIAAMDASSAAVTTVLQAKQTYILSCFWSLPMDARH